jgi:hypothetical protein
MNVSVDIGNFKVATCRVDELEKLDARHASQMGYNLRLVDRVNLESKVGLWVLDAVAQNELDLFHHVGGIVAWDESPHGFESFFILSLCPL